MEEFYKRLGKVKSEELDRKSDNFWKMLDIDKKSRKSKEATGKVREGLARDFIREFLPPGFGLKGGLIFNAQNKEISGHADAIIYKGAPLLEFMDLVVVEKEQVKAIFEIKTWIDKSGIFGGLPKNGGKDRNLSTGLAASTLEQRKFLPAGASYVLFTFDLQCDSSDDEVIQRLKELYHFYAVVKRKRPARERKHGEEQWEYNFDNSVSQLIEWLRNLS